MGITYHVVFCTSIIFPKKIRTYLTSYFISGFEHLFAKIKIGKAKKPHIFSNNRITFQGQVIQCRCEFFLSAAQHVKRIGRYAFHSVVCTIHNKFNSLCNGAKLSDNKFISQKFVVVCNVFFKLFRSADAIIYRCSRLR